MLRHKFFAITMSCLLAAAVACGPTEQQIEDHDADPNASVVIDQPVLYGCVGAGCVATGAPAVFNVETSIALDRAIQLVELFVGEDTTPVATSDNGVIEWDTSGSTPGLAQIRVRVTDEFDFVYESGKREIIVTTANSGSAVRYLSGTSFGTLNIPVDYNGTQEVDARHHWDNPGNITKIIGVARWDVPEGQIEWDIGIAIGCGICPHNGTTWGPEIFSDEGPLMNVITPDLLTPVQTYFDEDQAFVHLRPANAADHKGEQLPYQVSMYIFND